MRLYGLDIETDTSIIMLDGLPFQCGLDPRHTRVLSVAVTLDDEVSEVLAAPRVEDEVALLKDLDELLYDLPAGMLVSWNGSVFDFPFLDTRYTLKGVSTGLHVSYDPSIVPKYQPTPGYLGGVRVSWGTRFKGPHSHMDVAYELKEYAEVQGVPWNLKPVARSLGFDPVEVDRSKVHLLSPKEMADYVASDALVTRELSKLVLKGAI